MSKTASPTKVVTGKARLAYCNLLTPRAQEEGKDPKYSVCVLIPKTDKDTVAKIKAAIEAAKEAGKPTWGGKVPPGLKVPLRDGDTERDSEEYKGHWFVNASSKQMPQLVDMALLTILDANEIYSGMYGRVSINFFPYNTAGNRGIGAGLNNVQKLADGQPLSGRARAEDDFSTMTEEFLQ